MAFDIQPLVRDLCVGSALVLLHPQKLLWFLLPPSKELIVP